MRYIIHPYYSAKKAYHFKICKVTNHTDFNFRQELLEEMQKDT